MTYERKVSLDEFVNENYYAFYGVDNCTFKIGQIVFEAVEDEDDGYRSMLDGVESVPPENATNLIFQHHPIAYVKIAEADDGARHPGYYMEDRTGHVWLRIGTNDADDYYPYFVFEYKPKAP